MICVSRSGVQKVLTSGALAILLLCAPVQLSAQEREAPAAAKVSALAWFSGLWSDLTEWLTGGVVLDPKPKPTSDTDGGGCLDPHGGCGG